MTDAISTGSPRAAASAPEARPYYSVSEAARLLGVNRVTLWRWIGAGRLPVWRAGPRTVRIKRDDLERLLVRPGFSASGAPAQLDGCEHFVHFYESDAFLAEAVAEFVGGGLHAGEAGIVIATPEHVAAIEERLAAAGLDVAAMRAAGQYVALDAAEALGRFMVDGMPDRGRFVSSVGGLVERAVAGGRPLRAFGEMVALLALDGNTAAAVRLEELWNELGGRYSFGLFCAYPINRLAGPEFGALMGDVCATHARVVPSESYAAASDADRGRMVAELQQKAARLEAEIAQRMRAEAELRDFVESATIGMHWVGADGTVLWANRAELELIGYTAEEVVGRHIESFHADADVIAEILARLGRGETLRDHPARLRCKDGSIRQVLIDSSVLWEAGRFVHSRCFTRDVTELRKLEEERAVLLERERAARVAAEEQAAVHVALNAALRDVADERDRALAAERAARQEAERAAERTRRLQEITGQLSRSLDAAEVLASIARSAADLLEAPVGAVFLLDVSEPESDFALAAAHGIDTTLAPALRLPRYASLAGRAVDQGLTLVVDDVRSTPGTALPQLLTGETAGSEIAAPITVGDERLGVVKAFSPTVRRFDPDDAELLAALAAAAAVALRNARLYREAHEAIQARDEFLSSAAHDLKTPLTAIKGTAQFLRRLTGSPVGPDVARLAEGLTGVDAAATRVARQVDQLLDITRLRAGLSLELRRQPIDLVTLAEQIAAEHSQVTDRHRIRIDSEGSPLIGHWDRGRLQRVLDNLIGNAVKYSPNGGAVVVALSRQRRGDVDCAEIAISDQGIGIPAAELGRVFDRFSRGSNVPVPIGGSGIGLTSVRQIVERHGGTVSVESREGEGSTFTVRLPLGDDAVAEPPTADGTAAA